MQERNLPGSAGGTNALDGARARIRAAYDPEFLRRSGQVLAEALGEHLAGVQAGQASVLPWQSPAEKVREAATFLREDAPRAVPAAAAAPADAASQVPAPSVSQRDAIVEHFAQLVGKMLQHGLNLHHPRYLGHQVPASIPVAGLFDAVGSVTNQCMAIYEMGPWATAVEWSLVERLGQQIGWTPGQFSGLVTHGGSLANFTALLTARNVSLPDSWEHGVGGGDAAPVLLVHSDAHYCVSRSAGMLGIGTNQVLRVGLDVRRRMDPQRLDDLLSECRARKRPVLAVVACACATPIGAFDPLPEIAEVCRRHEVWLHVDAAHGGSACLSPRHRHLVAGLDRADSLVWDAHKMMFVPALCAFVLYRQEGHKFETFRQNAPYLFDPSAPGLAEYDSGMRAVECTKRAAAFGLWGVWSLFGPQLFADLVDTTFDLAQQLYERLEEAADFQPLHVPQCNIVTFRHVPTALQRASGERLGDFQLELRRRLIESGEYYIVSTKLDGVGALRVTLINPLTSAAELDRLLATLRRHGRQLLTG